MPITADYKWEDSEEVIVVLVPLRGAKLSTDHVFIANEYIKVNSAPYFLELDLHGEIRASESRAILSRDGLRLHLHKAEPGCWDSLVTELPKKERLARRQATVDERHEELRGLKETKKKERAADDKRALHQHFDMEDTRKRWIEEKKENELNMQADELEEWQRKEAAAAEMLQAMEAGEDAETNKAAISGDSGASMPLRRRRKKKVDKELFDKPDLPPPRAANPVRITFTQTTRPTPARADNPDQLGPNDAPRSKPVLKRVHNPDAVDIGEQNPVWLKDRGDQYFAIGDFASAANAYSAAISLDDDEYVGTIAGRVATYYSNRSACYFQMSKHQKCTSDCDRALELLELVNKGPATKADEKTLRSMCKLHARRAASLAFLGEVDEARRDYQQAILLSPEDMKHNLEGDLQRLDAVELKQDADAAVKLGHFPKAVELYAQARAVDPNNAALWSNTALCYLAMQNHEECIEACTNALQLLEASGDTSGHMAKVKTLLRRGTSRLELKQLHGALEDFQSASELMPSDKTIQDDLNKVKARVKRHDADTQYKAGELELAEEMYAQAVDLDPTDTKSRSNRTACLLKLHRYEECVAEACTILEHLDPDDASKAKVQALVRRGAAHAKLRNYTDGIRDYQNSLVIKEDPKVRLDMEAMKAEALRS